MAEPVPVEDPAAGRIRVGSVWLLTSFTDGQGAVSYGYDAGNELVSASEPGGDCTTNPGVNCTRFGYNANGARISTTYPGGTVQNTTVDPSGRPLRITATGPGANGAGTGTVFSDLGYGYTAGTSDRTVVQTRSNTVAEGAPNGSSTNYTYDSLNRLTTAAENLPGGGLNAAWSYAYDGAGNRTAQHVVVPGGQTVDTSYTYTPDNRLIQRNGDPTNIAYDPTGNQTSYPATGAVPGNTTAAAPQSSTQYDTANHSTIVTSAGTPVTMTYLNPDQNQRITAGGTYYGTGVLGVSYQTTNAATTAFTRTPGGQPGEHAHRQWEPVLPHRQPRLRHRPRRRPRPEGRRLLLRPLRRHPHHHRHRHRRPHPSQRESRPLHQRLPRQRQRPLQARLPLLRHPPGPLHPTGPLRQESNLFAYTGGDPVNFKDLSGKSFLSVVNGFQQGLLVKG